MASLCAKTDASRTTRSILITSRTTLKDAILDIAGTKNPAIEEQTIAKSILFRFTAK